MPRPPEDQRGDGMMLCVPALHGPSAVTIPSLMAVIRDRMQGRAAATITFVGMGLTPLGSLLGGCLAEEWELRTSLPATAAGMMLSPALMALSPLARLRRVLPDPQVAICDRSTPTVHDHPQTGHSNHAPPDKQVREHRRVERAQPRPELDERFLWFLRLQTAEVRDAVEDRYVGAIEQQLPGEASRG